jgi:hypothetical protein
VSEFCENGNESSGTEKGEEFLEQVRVSQSASQEGFVSESVLRFCSSSSRIDIGPYSTKTFGYLSPGVSSLFLLPLAASFTVIMVIQQTCVVYGAINHLPTLP